MAERAPDTHNPLMDASEDTRASAAASETSANALRNSAHPGTTVCNSEARQTSNIGSEILTKQNTTSIAEPGALAKAQDAGATLHRGESAAQHIKRQHSQKPENRLDSQVQAASHAIKNASASAFSPSSAQQPTSNPTNTTDQPMEKSTETSGHPDLLSNAPKPRQADNANVSGSAPNSAAARESNASFDPKQDSEGRWLPPGYYRRKPEADLPERYTHHNDVGIEQTSETSPVMAGDELDRDEFDREMSEDWKRRVTIKGRSYYVLPADPRGCGRTWYSPNGPGPALLIKIASQHQRRYDDYGTVSELSARERDKCAKWNTCLLDAFRIADHSTNEARTCFNLAPLFADIAGKEVTPYGSRNEDRWASIRHWLPAVRDGFMARNLLPSYEERNCFLEVHLGVIAFRSGDESASPGSRLSFREHVVDRHFVDWLQDLKQVIPDAERTWLLTVCIPDKFWYMSAMERMVMLLTAVITLGLDVGVFDGLLRRFGIEHETNFGRQQLLSPSMLVLNWSDDFTMITWPHHRHSLPCGESILPCRELMSVLQCH